MPSARWGRLLAVLAFFAPASPALADPGAELAAARAVFQRNLDAIQKKDRDAYLSCYLRSPLLARTGSQGFTLGYESLAAGTGSAWPDHFEGLDLRLTPVREGLVYGTYRYRVRYGPTEQAGLSERFFVSTPEGWKIAVTAIGPGKCLKGGQLAVRFFARGYRALKGIRAAKGETQRTKLQPPAVGTPDC